jgi:hypothetical protein
MPSIAGQAGGDGGGCGGAGGGGGGELGGGGEASGGGGEALSGGGGDASGGGGEASGGGGDASGGGGEALLGGGGEALSGGGGDAFLGGGGEVPGGFGGGYDGQGLAPQADVPFPARPREHIYTAPKEHELAPRAHTFELQYVPMKLLPPRRSHLHTAVRRERSSMRRAADLALDW